MEYVYFLEVDGIENRSNSAVFKLAKEMEIAEDNVFSDLDRSDRSQLEAALNELGQGDILIIRSAEDAADSIEGLCEVLHRLKERGAELYSCKEPYLNGRCAYDVVAGVRELTAAFQQRKKTEGYKRAVAEKRVGRPRKDKSIAKAVQLYKEGSLSIKEIEMVTGISKTTLYKNLKE